MPGLIWSSKGEVLSGGAGVPDGTAGGQLLVWNAAAGEWQPQLVTPGDIGAAAAAHTHTPASIGAVSTDNIIIGSAVVAPASNHTICAFPPPLSKAFAVIYIAYHANGVFLLKNGVSSLLPQHLHGTLTQGNSLGYWNKGPNQHFLIWENYSGNSHTLQYIVMKLGG